MIQEFKRLLAQFGIEYFGKYYSIYQATVIDNEDPDFRGRVKVSCPAVYGDDIYPYWALPMGLASSNTALWMIPNVGDVVWVQFEGGDARYPVWSWGWFKQDAAPNAAKVNGNKIDATVLQSKSGHRIVMDDKAETVTISNASGLHIVLTKTKVNIVGESQKAVKGNDLETWLGQLIDAIKTGTTVSGTPFNPAMIAALEVLKPQIKGFLSSKVALE